LKRRIFLLFFAIIVLLTIVSCSSETEQEEGAEANIPETVRTLTAAELMALGEKYLLELDYEQAIIHIQVLIEIEPKNEDAYIMLSSIYMSSGNPVRGQGVLEMGYVSMPENDNILNELLNVMIVNDDVGAMGRLVKEMHLLDTARNDTLEKMLQKLADEKKWEFMEELVESFKEHGNDEAAITLLLELTLLVNQDYVDDEARLEAILLMLEDRRIPLLAEGEELYVGEYDSQGRRNGFGVVFYGAGVQQDSVLYIGNFVDGLRSGTGIAYNSGGDFISGEWSNDLPNGLMTYSWGGRGYTRVSTLTNGLGDGTLTTYGRNGEIIWVDLIPKTDLTQTFESRPDLFSYTMGDGGHLGDCPCTHLAWDVPIPGY